MEPTQWQKSIRFYTQALTHLEQQLVHRTSRFAPFHSLFSEFVKHTDRFSNSLTVLTDAIDNHILSELTQTEESLCQHFLHLRSGLSGLCDTFKQVAVRSHNQILEPMRTFQDNYRKLCTQSIGHLKRSLAGCLNGEQDVVKNRDMYYQCCQKLQKHKESQAKIMMRIEGGDQAQLQRFNRTTKLLLERVSSSQKRYKQTVERVNKDTEAARSLAQKQLNLFKNNETSRVQFLKKIADSQLKMLDETQKADLGPKQEKIPKVESKGWTAFNKAANRIEQWAKQDIKEVYVSHEELVKSKKMKEFQQENPLLAELFHKVKQSEKSSLNDFASAILELEPGIRLVSLQRPPKEGRLVFPPQWQTFRQKIFSLQHYTLYFVHILNRNFSQLPSYYLKLSAPYYYHLKTFFKNILNKIDLLAEGAIGEACLSGVYQVLKMGQRVVLKTKGGTGAIRMLIQGLGESERLKDEVFLMRFSRFLVRRNQKKKQTKGMMQITKGWISSWTGKKQEDNSSQEEQFNALVELSHLIGNMALSAQVALPFLKRTLKHNQPSYQYLKDIILSKRDRDQRHRLTFENKKNTKIKGLLQGSLPEQSVFCLSLMAEKGYLSLQDLSLRLVCKSLIHINYNILYNLAVGPDKKLKWLYNPEPGTRFEQADNVIIKESQVQDIIQLDVQRSLQLHSEHLAPQSLKEFLVFYARQHNEMPYCQGMNYIAGIIMMKSQSRKVAYSIFCGMIERLFLPIFKDNFAGMQLKLYVLQRLIAIFHSDLSDHLRRQMITPECYSVGWIITAFSSVYQYTQKSYLLDWFWVRFGLWGWAEFYRLVMWIIHLQKETLVGAGYDRCLQVFGEVVKCSLWMAPTRQALLEECGGAFEETIQAYEVSEELLQRLEREFQHE